MSKLDVRAFTVGPVQENAYIVSAAWYRDIEPVLDQVEIAVIEHELNLHLGKGREESDDDWRDVAR